MCATNSLGYTIKGWNQTTDEKEADLFACDQLAKHGKTKTVQHVIDICEKQRLNPAKHLISKTLMRSAGIPHPTPQERADYLRDRLNKDKISI